jgi:poly(beta-D-mannuronate) lyase
VFVFTRLARLSAAALVFSCVSLLSACGGGDIGTPPIGSGDSAPTGSVPENTDSPDAADAGSDDSADASDNDDAYIDGVLEDAAPGEMDDATANDDGAKSYTLAPSNYFDLSHWYLTLPSAEAVKTVVLNGGYQYADVFFTDARSGGMVFKCPNIAGTTPNSTHSRTELREVLNPSNSSMSDPSNNWTTSMGGKMIASLRVDHVGTTGTNGGTTYVGNVVIGQIHAPDTEVVRLHYVKLPNETTGRVYAAMEDLSGHGIHSPDLVSNADGDGLKLGERFSYQIRLVGRTLTIYVARANHTTVKYTKTIDAGYVGKNLYFKAGVYNQDNGGDRADYAQATFFKLTHSHP